MSLNRTFLGWERPFLDHLAERLIDHVRSGATIDLSALTVVLPTSRAGRRLNEILALKSGRALLLPNIITVGELPELLYAAGGRVASDLESELAWARALARVDDDALKVLLPGGIKRDDLSILLGWATELHAMYKELSAASITIEALIERGEELLLFDDSERWETVALVRDLYLEELASSSLCCKHQQRLEAIGRGKSADQSTLILASLPDLNEVSCRLLETRSADVEIFIHAPQDLSDWFDRYGRVVTAKWLTREISPNQEIVSIEYSYSDESDRLCQRLSNVAARYAVDEITIGIGDKGIVPYLEERFVEKGIPHRYPAGRALSQSSPAQLIKYFATYLSTGAARDLAVLIRHPELHRYLESKLKQSGIESLSILSAFDHFHTEHLPQRISASASKGEAAISAIIEQINNLLDGFRSLDSASIARWSEVVSKILKTVYSVALGESAESVNASVNVAALKKIVEILNELTQLSGSTDINAETALRILVHRISSETISPTGNERAIELLEWLEIQLDDAPLLALTGVNDGKIPGILSADPFLPNSLRKGLGLLDNDRRYARDAFMFEAIINSRQVVSITASAFAPSGDPFLPSRLLLARPVSELPGLVPKLFGKPDRIITAKQPTNSNWRVPIRPTLKEYAISTLPVTAFKDYITCPYRYYLKHVLKLRSLSDRAMELDPLRFGSLAHDILRRFDGEASLKFKDSEQIFRYLSAELDKEFSRRFGKGVLPAVLIQTELLRDRLRAFADWQAEWSRQGWEIRFVELECQAKDTQLAFDGGVVGIEGRIDRIDFNSKTKGWAIFDYKTGDKEKTPQQTHLKNGAWRDLQLPLYRLLARNFGVTEPMLGLIPIGSSGFVTEQIAKWEESELAQAEKLAATIAARISRAEFWPPSDSVTGQDDFAVLCGTDQMVEEGEGETAEVESE